MLSVTEKQREKDVYDIEQLSVIKYHGQAMTIKSFLSTFFQKSGRG